MNNCRNYDGLLTLQYIVNYFIGKALGVPPTNILAGMFAGIEPWIQSKVIEKCQEFVNRSVTKTIAAAVIPRSNFDNVILYFGS